MLHVRHTQEAPHVIVLDKRPCEKLRRIENEISKNIYYCLPLISTHWQEELNFADLLITAVSDLKLKKAPSIYTEENGKKQ